jgi:serine 3-dehydrogenase
LNIPIINMSQSKIILITGGSTGIGAATAKLLIQAGHQVIVTGRTKASLEKLEQEINNENLKTIVSDVANWEDQQNLKKQILEKHGRIDVVFANAGFTSGSNSFFEGQDTPDDWKDMILTNVYGAAITARAFLPELIKTKGQLLLTGSVVGRVASTGRLYSSTKWAITGMAESIRKELVGKGVRVTLVEPGAVETPFWGEKMPFAGSLQPEDIARSVAFCIEQPHGVDINEILIRPSDQGI